MLIFCILTMLSVNQGNLSLFAAMLLILLYLHPLLEDKEGVKEILKQLSRASSPPFLSWGGREGIKVSSATLTEESEVGNFPNSSFSLYGSMGNEAGDYGI